MGTCSLCLASLLPFTRIHQNPKLYEIDVLRFFFPFDKVFHVVLMCIQLTQSYVCDARLSSPHTRFVLSQKVTQLLQTAFACGPTEFISCIYILLHSFSSIQIG